MFERVKNFLNKKEGKEKTPEEIRVDGLKSRLKELDKEREKIFDDSRSASVYAPRIEGAGPNPRLEQINQEAENIQREIDGLPPLNFHGSIR